MKDFFDEYIVVIAAIYFAIMVPVIFLIYYRIKKWPWTEGELLNAKVNSIWDGDTSFYEKVSYKYWVEGEEFIGNRLSVNTFRGSGVGPIIEKQLEKIQYLPNGKIKVFYNPRKPRKSYLLV